MTFRLVAAVSAFLVPACGSSPDEGSLLGGDHLATPTIETLVYDDGEAEGGMATIAKEGGFIGVRFSPPETPARLIDARFFITDADAPATEFGVQLFHIELGTSRPGELMLDTGVRMAATTGNEWVTIDLSEHDIIAQGDVLVAMEWLPKVAWLAPTQYLGADRSEPNERAWRRFRIEDEWKPMAEIHGDEDAMIRCTFEYPVL